MEHLTEDKVKKRIAAALEAVKKGTGQSPLSQLLQRAKQGVPPGKAGNEQRS